MNQPDLDELQRRHYDHGAHPLSFDEINEIIAYARELEQQLANSRAGHDITITIAQDAISRIKELEAALKPFADFESAFEEAARVLRAES